jgi:hypothetical protein
MSNILLLNVPRVDVGLVTDIFTIPSTGLYNLEAQITEIPPSGLSIVVNQNGSPIYTAPALTPTQSAIQFKVDINGVAADTITLVLSSSNANDALLESVKTNVSIGQGY